MAKLSDRISRWGLGLALIAIYYTAFPILVQFVNDVTGKSIWAYTGSWVNLPYNYQETAGLIILLAGPIILILLFIKWAFAK